MRESTVQQFPASFSMAGAIIDLLPGGLRGYHWHKEGAEYGTVLEGRVLLMIVDEQNRQEVGVVEKGDVYYVPRAFGHALACLGEAPCKVLAVYDEGSTVESTALNAVDWISGSNPQVLSNALRTSGPKWKAASANSPILMRGSAFTDQEYSSLRTVAHVPESFRYRMTQMPPQVFSGGSFVEASISDFPNSRTMVGAFTLLKPGASREPHWHPNADEWDFVVSGRARIVMFDGGKATTSVEVSPGQIGFLPRGQAHSVETVGDEDFYLFSVFNTDTFQAVELSGSIIALPPEVIALNFGASSDMISKLPSVPQFISTSPAG